MKNDDMLLMAWQHGQVLELFEVLHPHSMCSCYGFVLSVSSRLSDCLIGAVHTSAFGC
jgi:hypothetical protein